MAGTASAARLAAARIVAQVMGAARPMGEAAPEVLSALGPEDRARAQRLAMTTFRWADRADRILGPFLKKRPEDAAMAVLRLGTVEICGAGAPPHAVVNDCVAVTRALTDSAPLAGLVNAVLRRVAADGPAAWDRLPVPRLPKWLRKPLLSQYGRETVEAIEGAHSRGAPLDLTPRDGDAAALASRIGGAVLPTGSVRLAGQGPVSGMPGHAEGEWWVQDAAAALPVRVLAPRPGERILDLCAAPGGKTLQLAAAGAAVTAVDMSSARLVRLHENLARTGLSATVVEADARDFEAPAFDAVLLDAPCSGTGTIRRHPDLPHAKAALDLAPLFAVQAALLDRAVALTRPGGRLVFSTCSLLQAEGEEQVRAALSRHPELVPDPRALLVPGVDPSWAGPEGLRLRPDFWPDEGGMDGFFIAAFRRVPQSPE